MKKTFIKIVVLCGILGLGLAGIAMANGALDGDGPAMMVSPSTIVLAKVDTISVHTNIPKSIVYSENGEYSLFLDGVSPTFVYEDNLGHIAAKFLVSELGLEPGKATLTLLGDLEFEDEDGEIVIVSFSANDVVTVK